MTPGKYEELAMRSQASQMDILIRLEKTADSKQLQLTQLRNGVTGLTDEVGELNSAVKKAVEYGQPLDITNIQEEVGDCLWRLVQICQAVGYSLEQAMIHNIEKLKVRYPNGYTDFQAAEENRDRQAERQLLEEPTYHSYQQIKEQTGQGWAEPVESPLDQHLDCSPQKTKFWLEQAELPKADPVIIASFGDGLVRDQFDSSYNRLCNQCHKDRVHRSNSTGICPNCAAEIRCGRRILITKE